MATFSLHGLSLEVAQDRLDTGTELSKLLRDLSFISIKRRQSPTVRLFIQLSEHELGFPSTAREVFDAEGLCGLEAGDEFFLTEGSSLFHLQASKGRGEAQLAPAFFHQPALLQQRFWAFGLLKLFRPKGIYALHAAGLVAPCGMGLLSVGDSGSGKLTLAIGLIRQGWRYLSDDALLLRLQPEGVEALAFRKPFSINATNATAAAAYANMANGGLGPPGGRKRRVCIEEVYPGQYVPGCVPHTLLFSRIVSHPSSALLPLDRHSALRHLLTQSGPPLFDRRTMAPHLEVLKRLVQQSATYELQAGRDLYHHPEQLVHLLAEAGGGKRWLE